MGVLVGMAVIVGSRVGYEVGELVGANDGSIVGPPSEQHVNDDHQQGGKRAEGIRTYSDTPGIQEEKMTSERSIDKNVGRSYSTTNKLRFLKVQGIFHATNTSPCDRGASVFEGQPGDLYRICQPA